MARDRKELANVTIRLSKHVPDAETRNTSANRSQTKRAENVERLVIWQVCVDDLELVSPRPRVVRRAREVAKGGNAVKTCWNCGESGHMSSQCPKKKVHAVEESTTASQAGSQDTIMVGSVGSNFDVGSVSEVTLEPRGAGEKLCSMGVPTVREGEPVDIEIDSGADVSCFLMNIGAGTYPLHEAPHVWDHFVVAAGGKLHGLEAANVRGDVVNLLVRFKIMNIGKARLSTQDLSRCGWETVFPAGCGDAYLVRESFGHSHHAREETLCLVPESQTQTSQGVAMHWK